jgi:hypothetical protein
MQEVCGFWVRNFLGLGVAGRFSVEVRWIGRRDAVGAVVVADLLVVCEKKVSGEVGSDGGEGPAGGYMVRP